jgi:hypothetical protein
MPTEPHALGYHHKHDSFYFASSNGSVYYVYGPDTVEPTWERIGPPLPDGAKPRTPIAEVFKFFERSRREYGIPE